VAEEPRPETANLISGKVVGSALQIGALHGDMYVGVTNEASSLATVYVRQDVTTGTELQPSEQARPLPVLDSKGRLIDVPARISAAVALSKISPALEPQAVGELEKLSRGRIAIRRARRELAALDPRWRERVLADARAVLANAGRSGRSGTTSANRSRSGGRQRTDCSCTAAKTALRPRSFSSDRRRSGLPPATALVGCRGSRPRGTRGHELGSVALESLMRDEALPTSARRAAARRLGPPQAGSSRRGA
jgi:hypothetical protein